MTAPLDNPTVGFPPGRAGALAARPDPALGRPLRRMPARVRALRGPWETLVPRVRDLTAELEQDFRFGQRITRTEPGYMMGGTMKGGSSSMWYPVTRTEYEAFRRWRALEGIPEGRDDEALEGLQALLGAHGVRLATRRHAPQGRGRFDPAPFPGYGPLYADMLGILAALPVEHLERDTLRGIQLGGWGPDAAKASAYHEREVLMYDFACRGARRTFLGLFLHEVGHAHEAALDEPTRAELYECYRVMVEADAFFGVEFLLDAETRRIYQKLVFGEFLAEAYMLYAACGQGLRDGIEGLGDREAREAWRRAYDVLRNTFLGVEYE